MAVNLIFGLYIIIKHLIPLKIKGTFIVSFYAASCFMTIMRIIELGYCIYDPSTQDWEYGYGGSTFYRVVAIIATLSSFGLGLLMISTMYQIALSIKVLVGDVGYQEGKKRRNCFYWMLLSLVVGFSLFIVLANIERIDLFKMKSTMFITFIVIFSLLSIIFTATICILMKAMDKINDEKDFRREKLSILMQFFVFLVAFVSRAVFYSLELYLVKSEEEIAIT